MPVLHLRHSKTCLEPSAPSCQHTRALSSSTVVLWPGGPSFAAVTNAALFSLLHSTPDVVLPSSRLLTLKYPFSSANIMILQSLGVVWSETASIKVALQRPMLVWHVAWGVVYFPETPGNSLQHPTPHLCYSCQDSWHLCNSSLHPATLMLYVHSSVLMSTNMAGLHRHLWVLTNYIAVTEAGRSTKVIWPL